MEQNHESPDIKKTFRGDEYRMQSTHNLNIRKHQVRVFDTFIADIIFFKIIV